MRKYFFKIQWSLKKDCQRIKKEKLLYWSTIPENPRNDIRDKIKEVFRLEPNSRVSIDNIKRISTKAMKVKRLKAIL